MARQIPRESKEWLPGFTPASDILKAAIPHGVTKEGYYGVPMLKRPTWRWHIALYFFFEGVSAGSFLMASLADLFGNGRWRELTRAGYYTAFLALLPCPPLLIADLGRPERFHHMLRVFKPESPMNLGAWTLTAYSAPLTLLAADQLMNGGSLLPVRRGVSQLVPARVLGALGIPMALTMSSYTGVLLSTTSTPIWAKSRWLGALFACSAISTGAAATALHLALRGNVNSMAIERLEKIKNLASVCEGAALVGYLATSGKAAQPLMSGRYGWQLWLGAVGVGLALPAIVRATAPKPRNRGLWSTLLSSALSLAGGFALKWAITYAGRASAKDAEAARYATQPSRSASGWSPNSLNAPG